MRAGVGRVMALETGIRLPVREASTIGLRPLPLLLGAALLASLFFRAFPAADLETARLFYRPGEGFPLSRDPWLVFLREVHLFTPYVCAAAALFALAIQAFGARLSIRQALPRPSGCIFLTAVMLLGPGLLVHGMKAAFGRARPRDLSAFGGDALFALPWQVSDACLDNCSFVSGEAASGAALMALPLILPCRWRPVAWAVVTPFALLVSLNRVAFGAHFLSDVVIGWCLVLALVTVLWQACLTHGAGLDARIARSSNR